MMEKYILEGKTPVPINDLMEWAAWFEKADRHVKSSAVGDILISTVFLGFNHQWVKDAPPLLFETMIFGGPLDQYQTRCSTWDEAEAQHAEALALVNAGLN